jgi:hypothetical protein
MTNKKDTWKIFIGVAIFYLLGMIGYAIVTNLKPIGNWISQITSQWYSLFYHEFPYSFIGITAWILIICGIIVYLDNYIKTTDDDALFVWLSFSVIVIVCSLLTMLFISLT